jgi:hypothetical protein
VLAEERAKSAKSQAIAVADQKAPAKAASAKAKAPVKPPAKASKSTGDAKQPSLFRMGITKEIKTKNNTVYSVVDAVPPKPKDQHVCPVCHKTCKKASGLASHMKKHAGFGDVPEHAIITDKLFPAGRGSDAIYSFYRETPPAHAPPPSGSGPGQSHVRDHWQFYEGACFVTETRPDGSTHFVFRPEGVKAAEEDDMDIDSDEDVVEVDAAPDSAVQVEGKQDGRSCNRGARKRKQYTYQFKADVLMALEKAHEKKVPAPQQVVADSAGINQSTLSKWEKRQVR